VLAHVESIGFTDHPGFVTWDWENGAPIFAITGEIFGPSSEPGQLHTMCTQANPWDYALDFGANLMIYLDRRPVPQDVELVHRLRTRMFEFYNRRALLLGVVEFSDSFGANTDSVNLQIDQINEMVGDVLPVYLELRFEEVLQTYEEAHEMLAEAEEEAVELKNRALIWVYVVEWLGVTGTAMLSGFVVWSLMIRRKLYREVQTTKLATHDF
jgi:hypothetical protein